MQLPPTRAALTRIRHPRSSGQALVEFGIVVIIFFLLISGIVDFGRALNAWVVVSSAAREGVRWASIGAEQNAVEARARAFSLVPGVPSSGVTVEVTYSDAGGAVITQEGALPGDLVTVRVTATTFEIVTPLVRPAFCGTAPGPCHVPIGSQTTMRYEGPFVQ